MASQADERGEFVPPTEQGNISPEPFRATGAEFPPVVYRLVMLLFVWFLLAALFAFSHASGLDLGISVMIFTVMLGLPVVLRHANPLFRRGANASWETFHSSEVDVATGRLSGDEATIQVLLIPAALALAATLISGVYIYAG